MDRLIGFHWMHHFMSPDTEVWLAALFGVIFRHLDTPP